MLARRTAEVLARRMKDEAAGVAPDPKLTNENAQL